MHSLARTFCDLAAVALRDARAKILVQAEDGLLSEAWLNHEVYLGVRQHDPALFCGREPFYTHDFDGTVDRSDLDRGAFRSLKMDIYTWREDGTELFAEAKLLTPWSVCHADQNAFDADHERLVRACAGRRVGVQLIYLHSVDGFLADKHPWIRKRGAWARRAPDFCHEISLSDVGYNRFHMLAWSL